MGGWKLMDAQAEALREYLLGSGLPVLDDFFGREEWIRFMESMICAVPDRSIVEISDDAPIFHVVHDPLTFHGPLNI